MNKLDQATTWDQIADVWHERSPRSTELIEYGPWAPTEAELQLLGSVQGLRVLEIGCGGGQCSIAFARQGATVVGIDISPVQIAYASRLADGLGVDVHFVVAAADDLSEFANGAWDLVFSSYTFHYVENLARCLAECYRVLCDSGRLVFSLDHPLRTCFFDEVENELTLYPTRSYFDPTPLRWRFPETTVIMQSYHYTISDWINGLISAGFASVQVVEPETPKTIAQEQWPDDGPMFPMRNLPQTMIVIGKKSALAHSRQ